MDVTPPFVVALDLPNAEAAVRLAQRLEPYVGGYKIGLGLLLGPGPALVGALAELGKPVFADAKLHDIPSQVEAAARSLGRHGARWVTTHAGGGKTMIEAAVSGLESGSGSYGGILAVTVLTSLDAAALAQVGIPVTPGKLVSKMARVAAAAGAEGVVCSPHELGVVAEVAPELKKVTPGIRPAGAANDDQSRVATPEEAIRRGADLLVIGRPITGADDPVAAAKRVAEQLRPLSTGSG
jgi:orotidine-5'-phosphate decarboxylase